MAVPKKKGMSGAFAKALKKTSSTKTPQKKSSARDITNPPTDVAQEVDLFNKFKDEEEAAKAEKEFHREPILEFFHQILDESGFSGDYQNSFKIHGAHTSVTVSAINRFSINPEDEDKIAKIVGKFFDFLFRKEYVVKLKDEVINDPDKQNELMGLIGEDRFLDFFETKESLTTSKDFTREVYNFLDHDQLTKLRTYIKQARPSVK